jgi:hypothetical protein
MNEALFNAVLGDPETADKDFKAAMKHHWCVVKQSCLNEYGQLCSFRSMYRYHPKYRGYPSKVSQAYAEFDRIIGEVAGESYIRDMERLVEQRSTGFVIGSRDLLSENIYIYSLTGDYEAPDDIPQNYKVNQHRILNSSDSDDHGVQTSCIDRPIVLASYTYKALNHSKVSKEGQFTRKDWRGFSVPCMLHAVGVDLSVAPWSELYKNYTKATCYNKGTCYNKAVLYSFIRGAVRIHDTVYILHQPGWYSITYTKGNKLKNLEMEYSLYRSDISFGPLTDQKPGKLGVLKQNGNGLVENDYVWLDLP